MPDSHQLLAWIEPIGDGTFRAAFVSALAATSRAPATRAYNSASEARRWIEAEAAAVDLPIEWLDHPPTSSYDPRQREAQSGQRTSRQTT